MYLYYENIEPEKENISSVFNPKNGKFEFKFILADIKKEMINKNYLTPVCAVKFFFQL